MVSDCGIRSERVVVERGQVSELREIILDTGKWDGEAVGVGRGLRILVTLGEGTIHGGRVFETQQRTLEYFIERGQGLEMK